METEIKTQIGEIVDFINTECRKEAACVDTVNQKIVEVKSIKVLILFEIRTFYFAAREGGREYDPST